MLNPTHNILGFKLRMVFLQPHHMWWGILGALLSVWGIVSAIQLGGTLGVFLLVIQILAMLIWLYIALDDWTQHILQVKDPTYHSPVHWWYVGYVYTSDNWFAKLIRRLNEWADRKTS